MTWELLRNGINLCPLFFLLFLPASAALQAWGHPISSRIDSSPVPPCHPAVFMRTRRCELFAVPLATIDLELGRGRVSGLGWTGKAMLKDARRQRRCYYRAEGVSGQLRKPFVPDQLA